MKLSEALKLNGYSDEDLAALPEWVQESEGDA